MQLEEMILKVKKSLRISSMVMMFLLMYWNRLYITDRIESSVYFLLDTDEVPDLLVADFRQSSIRNWIPQMMM
jgi:hypothetical protein